MYGPVEVGEALLLLRRRQNQKQYTLANRAQISQGKLSCYENGKLLPSFPTLQRLLEALGSDFAELERLIHQHRQSEPEVGPPAAGAGRSGGTQPSLALRPSERAALERLLALGHQLSPAELPLVTDVCQQLEQIRQELLALEAS
ncbi:MAG: helix-turn-helix transcriptional regulator [Thermoanaerobaculia bacterium]